MKLLTLVSLLTVLIFMPATAQNVDNKGKEFVVGFSRNFDQSNNNVLFLTGDTATVGLVEQPGTGFSEAFVITPGMITSVVLPNDSEHLTNNAVEAKGVRITAEEEIVVYGLNQEEQTTDAFLGLPAEILGTDHIVAAFNGLTATVGSQLLVVARNDATTVEITPSSSAVGRTIGVPFSISLNALETYLLETDTAGGDLTGSIITSDKAVAVFGGGRCLNIPLGTAFCDHIVEQLPATGAWGQSFLTAPLATRTGGDLFRIIARDDATDILVDGVNSGSINRGAFLELNLASATYHTISATGPVLVMQYSKGTNADGVTSDPFMMMIPPTEQFQDGYTVTTPDVFPVAFTNFINVVAQTTDVASCTIDGGPYASGFTPIGSSGFSAALEPVAIGSHVLDCPNPFGAYSYGFASFDSYGYPGGLALVFIAAPRCDVDRDGDVDRTDINLIFAARNQASNGPEDPRDADGDLTITVLDSRQCAVQCTLPGCASPPPPL